MVNFGPLTVEIGSGVWGTPANFNWFRVLAALLHGSQVVGVSHTAALNRGCHLYSAGRPSCLALADILHRESKKGATLTMAITLSILDRFAKFFHCSKQQ